MFIKNNELYFKFEESNSLFSTIEMSHWGGGVRQGLKASPSPFIFLQKLPTAVGNKILLAGAILREKWRNLDELTQISKLTLDTYDIITD